MTEANRLAEIVAFSAVGAVTTTQDLAARVLDGIEGSDPELVAEETLALVCTTTARAASFALSDHPELARAAGSMLVDLPMTYHDYLIGATLLGGTPESLIPTDVYPRLGRKQAFYTAHLQDGLMPGPRALADVMALWMGRVSPPRLPEMPQQRLARLGLVEILVRHASLIRSRVESET